MPGLTKTRHTNEDSSNDRVKTDYTEKKMSAKEMISNLSSNLPDWAVSLRGLRHRESLTQKELGEVLSIKQSNISLMERGKRSIGKDLAKRLADFFETDYRLFL